MCCPANVLVGGSNFPPKFLIQQTKILVICYCLISYACVGEVFVLCFGNFGAALQQCATPCQ